MAEGNRLLHRLAFILMVAAAVTSQISARALADDVSAYRQGNETEQLAIMAHRGDHDALTKLKARAEQGDLEAQSELASSYMLGGIGGEPENFRESAKWYQMIADRGNLIGDYNLGVLYSRPVFGMQDDAAAVQCFLKAAQCRGAWPCRSSQADLAQMYADGRGAKQSYAEAYFWSSLAYKESTKPPISGFSEETVASYAAHLTPKQKAATDKRITEWWKKHPPARPIPLKFSTKHHHLPQ